jgi:uncharacterized repeat protein (TIGR04138 family)
MSPDDFLTEDVPCIQCHYNLRGLAPSARCPECGLPIVDTLSSPLTQNASVHQIAQRLRFMDPAREIGYPVDAIMFVLDAVNSATRLRPRNQHMNARDVCLAVRDLAAGYFNDRAEALELLTGWRIRSSEDIGKITFALVRAHHLHAAPNDCEEQFAGLFTLEQLLQGAFA